MKNKIFIAAIAIMLAALSCAGPSTFINQDTDWTFYKRIGVLPLSNLSQDRFAGEKFQSALITELFLTRRFDVVEPGEFNSKVAEALKAANVQPGQELSLDLIKAIGQKAEVQAVIEGVIREYTTVRVGQSEYPLISVNIRMIDVPTGTVIWMTSYTKKGGPKLPIISLGETHTLGELTQKTCHDIIEDFIVKAF